MPERPDLPDDHPAWPSSTPEGVLAITAEEAPIADASGRRNNLGAVSIADRYAAMRVSEGRRR